MVEKDDVVKKAINAKQQEWDRLGEEIAEMEKELEVKKKRAISLENFIEQGKLLVGAEEAESESLVPVAVENNMAEDVAAFGKSDVARKAAEILRDLGGPLKAGRIALEFGKRGWSLSPNGREVLRMAMRKRPKVFVKHRDGSFSLRER